MRTRHHHFKLYKPFGILSQLNSNDKRQLRTKKLLRSLYDFPQGSMPIGRLDEKSEGLLLVTTDGKVSDTINRSGIEKEYWAQVDGTVTEKALEDLREGIEIGLDGKKYATKACKARKLLEAPKLPVPHSSIRLDRHRPSSWLSITVREGKYRQIRKMTAAVGLPTLRLVRVRIGSIELGNLSEGQVIPLEALVPAKP